MVTIVDNGNAYEFRGLSTDEKPLQVSNAAGQVFDLSNGCIFLEMDTSKVFALDADTKTWLEL